MYSNILTKFARMDGKGQTLLTPFVLNQEKKILYFHIAKTGGSTITQILRNNGIDERVLTNKKLSYNNKLEYFKNIVKEWDAYFKFTFIRNKYDLLVSNWHYDKRPGTSFENFIKNIVIPNKDIYDFWIDQYYLTVIKNKPIFDFIGRYENFNKDLAIILNRLNIKKYNKNLKLNVGSYNHSKSFVEYYNKETAALVYKKFKKEIDYFAFTLKDYE